MTPHDSTSPFYDRLWAMIYGAITGAVVGLLIALAKMHFGDQPFAGSYIRNGALLFALAGLVAGAVVNAVASALWHFLWGALDGVITDSALPDTLPDPKDKQPPKLLMGFFLLGFLTTVVWLW